MMRADCAIRWDLLLLLALMLTVVVVDDVNGFAPPPKAKNYNHVDPTRMKILRQRQQQRQHQEFPWLYLTNNDGNQVSFVTLPNRRTILSITIASAAATAAAVASSSVLLFSSPAFALVKGVSPPPPRKVGSGSISSSDKPKCTNVEECQALAEQREAELRAEEGTGPPPKVTQGGVKYKDIQLGMNTDSSEQQQQQVQIGDQVNVFFKVLKLGKRSYDGLSGEGTVVFSRGYGLEDDEDEPGVKSFQFLVGNQANIVALNEALVGMKLHGIRRFAIVPQKGWEKATAMCDGGPGGTGVGGNVRTDYVVVPTAQMVEQESCFDKTKLPFPVTYAQQRRMAQRFDQSLIMEVQVVEINNNKDDRMM